jgi:hypothetical protein
METKHHSKVSDGIKIVLTAAAITGSIGLWSNISLNSIKGSSQTAASQANNSSSVASTTSTSSLRVVNMAVPQSSTVSKPQVQSIVVNGNNSGSSAPFTNTRTS